MMITLNTKSKRYSIRDKKYLLLPLLLLFFSPTSTLSSDNQQYERVEVLVLTPYPEVIKEDPLSFVTKERKHYNVRYLHTQFFFGQNKEKKKKQRKALNKAIKARRDILKVEYPDKDCLLYTSDAADD